MAHHPRKIVAALAGLVMIAGLLEAPPPIAVRAGYVMLSGSVPPPCTLVAVGVVGVEEILPAGAAAYFYVSVTSGAFVSLSAGSGSLVVGGISGIDTFTAATLSSTWVDLGVTYQSIGPTTPAAWQHAHSTGDPVSECLTTGSVGPPPAPPPPSAGPLVTRIDPPEGPYYGGTTVTITGTGLTGASVTFGGVVAKTTGWGDTKITVESPRSPSGPARDAIRADVKVIRPGWPSATSSFTYRGVAVVFVRGMASAWPPVTLPPSTDGFTSGGGIQGFLQEGGWPANVFLNYSYIGGTVTSAGEWQPTPYGSTDAGAPSPFDSLAPSIMSDTHVLRTTLLEPYLTMHPNTDVYLVGHSQGGLIAFAYLAELKARNVAPDQLPSGGRLAGIVTLDSPIGGMPTNIWDTSPGGLLRDTVDMKAVYASGGVYPAGSTRSIGTLYGFGNITNQQLATGAATHAVRILTVGNERDWSFLFGVPVVSSFLDTQWLVDGGTGSGLYSRGINEGIFPCKTSLLSLPWDYFTCNHELVFKTAQVETSILDVIEGRTPNHLGLLFETPRFTINLRASAQSVPHGTAVTLSGTVRPVHRGATVTIQSKVRGTWRTIKTLKLNSASAFSYRWAPGTGAYVLRANIARQINPDAVGNVSTSVTVRVR